MTPLLRTATVLVAGLVAGLVSLAGPLAAATTPAAAAAPENGPTVTVTDPDDVLSPSSEDTLATETPRIGLPDQVRDVTYIVLDSSEDGLGTDEQFNDGILDWVGDHEERLVPDGTGEGATWAPGSLIIAVGVSSRGYGVYCGDDVCSALDLFEGGHLDRTLADMRPALQRGNWTVAMLDGARTAADPSLVVEESGPSGTQILAGAGVLAVVGGGGAWWAVAAHRRKKAATARGQFDEISDRYTDVALRMDQIDVRANSLTSPVADDELRRQWRECRDAFLAVDTGLSATGLSQESDDKAFRSHAATLADAHRAMTRMVRAEDTIDRIFAMEHGDTGVRRRELSALSDDVTAARAGTTSPGLQEMLSGVSAQVEALSADLDAPDFMDRYAAIVRSYGQVLSLVREQEMDGLSTDDGDRHAPRIYDADYRVGAGHGNWIPFALLSSWHTADVEAAQSATSSGTNVSFSSGFSGGGGSARF